MSVRLDDLVGVELFCLHCASLQAADQLAPQSKMGGPRPEGRETWRLYWANLACSHSRWVMPEVLLRAHRLRTLREQLALSTEVNHERAELH